MNENPNLRADVELGAFHVHSYLRLSPSSGRTPSMCLLKLDLRVEMFRKKQQLITLLNV
jgi:hypothetical protein